MKKKYLQVWMIYYLLIIYFVHHEVMNIPKSYTQWKIAKYILDLKLLYGLVLPWYLKNVFHFLMHDSDIWMWAAKTVKSFKSHGGLRAYLIWE